MKINNKADVHSLEEKIKNELHIDVRKYRDEKVAEDFMDILLFPKYFASWVLPVIAVSFVLYLLGFFVVDLVNMEYLVYAILGFFLFMGTGLFLGLLLFVWQFKSDLVSVTDYTMNTMKTGLSDLGQVYNSRTSKKGNILSLLFKGIIFVVTIPMMRKAVSKKIPLLGFVMVPLFSKVLGNLSERVHFDEEPMQQTIGTKEPQSKLVQTYEKVVDKANSGVSNALSKAIRVVQLPLQVGFVISLLFLLGFLYLIW